MRKVVSARPFGIVSGVDLPLMLLRIDSLGMDGDLGEKIVKQA